jgi:hypothetical protein
MLRCRGCNERIWQFEVDSGRAIKETEDTGYHAGCIDKIEPRPVWAIDAGRD